MEGKEEEEGRGRGGGGGGEGEVREEGDERGRGRGRRSGRESEGGGEERGRRRKGGRGRRKGDRGGGGRGRVGGKGGGGEEEGEVSYTCLSWTTAAACGALSRGTTSLAGRTDPIGEQCVSQKALTQAFPAPAAHSLCRPDHYTLTV